MSIDDLLLTNKIPDTKLRIDSYLQDNYQRKNINKADTY